MDGSFLIEPSSTFNKTKRVTPTSRWDEDKYVIKGDLISYGKSRGFGNKSVSHQMRTVIVSDGYLIIYENGHEGYVISLAQPTTISATTSPYKGSQRCKIEVHCSFGTATIVPMGAEILPWVTAIFQGNIDLTNPVVLTESKMSIGRSSIVSMHDIVSRRRWRWNTGPSPSPSLSSMFSRKLSMNGSIQEHPTDVYPENSARAPFDYNLSHVQRETIIERASMEATVKKDGNAGLRGFINGEQIDETKEQK